MPSWNEARWRQVFAEHPGLSFAEIGKKVGRSAGSVYKANLRFDLGRQPSRKGSRPPRALKDPEVAKLTPDQFRDFQTLTQCDFGFSREEALAILRRPKRVLTCRPPSERIV